ncbi:MAG: AzlC family ABC transporter permease [Actinomycetota bacterium]
MRDPALEIGFRAGVRAILPFTVAVVGFGISFGVLARSAGMGPMAATVMSGTTFAGSAQFAAAGILEAGGTAAAAILAAILLNARYAAIGISVASALSGPLWRRLLLAQLVVDESWAIAHLGQGRYDRGRLVGAGVVLYVTWVVSTAVGALGAELLGDPEALGLDAAFPALFLALLWPQLRGPRAIAAAVLGAGIALALLPVAPPGVPIIAAAAACLIGLGDR